MNYWIFQEATYMFNFNPNHIKKFIEPQIITKNGILVFRSILGTSVFFIIVNILWFWGLSFDDSQVIYTLFLKYCGTHVCLPGVA
jgi:hypothetical protein